MNIRGYGQDSDDVLVVVEKGHGMTVHTMEHLAVMFGPGKDDRRVFEDAGRHSRNARDIEPEGHTFFGGSDVLSGYGSVLVDDDAVAAHKDYITKVAIFWDDEGRDGITDQSDEPRMPFASLGRTATPGVCGRLAFRGSCCIGGIASMFA